MRQSAFAAALLDPEAAVPDGVVDPYGAPAPKRFSVYRNNVASSLVRALEAAFPTVRKLVGEEFFSAMAGAFCLAHPPRSRMLVLYGDELPGWLESFPPVAHLGYLPDVARLDQAMRESYHAADSDPLPEAEFQRLLGEDIGRMRLALAPSLRLVPSRWPIVSVWAANHEGGAAPRPMAEDAIILRPEFDPRPQALPPGGRRFVSALLAGQQLADAVEIAGPELDLPVALGLLILGRAIAGVNE
jgi:Putative DNA-binding domain